VLPLHSTICQVVDTITAEAKEHGFSFPPVLMFSCCEVACVVASARRRARNLPIGMPRARSSCDLFITCAACYSGITSKAAPNHLSRTPIIGMVSTKYRHQLETQANPDHLRAVLLRLQILPGGERVASWNHTDLFQCNLVGCELLVRELVHIRGDGVL
jgi:hypothetical protein